MFDLSGRAWCVLANITLVEYSGSKLWILKSAIRILNRCFCVLIHVVINF